MIISATFSKPGDGVFQKFGKEYLRIKAKVVNTEGKTSYFLEAFTEKQAFHFNKTEEEMWAFIEENAGITFKACVIRTENEETQILANKKGKITRIVKKIGIAGECTKGKAGAVVTPLNEGTEKTNRSGKYADSTSRLKNTAGGVKNSSGNSKNYIIPEGTPVPFLVLLGIMTPEGRVIASKYDKFRQINRFLEFIDDILPQVLALKEKEAKNITETGIETTVLNGQRTSDTMEPLSPLNIVDFGCGKSYLTFAVQYFLTSLRNVPCRIFGLDLKQDVIDYCNSIAQKLKLENLLFKTGNIQEHKSEENTDIIITLHACDTATDFALDYAVKHNCKAILSVPCCQHEVNAQLDENIKKWKKIKTAGTGSNATGTAEAEECASETAESTPTANSEIKQSAIPEDFSLLLKYGIAKERFSALLTDVIRCDYLEKQGYSVQLMEFINMENTPKNLLIRAVKKTGGNAGAQNSDTGSTKKTAGGKTAGTGGNKTCLKSRPKITETLNIRPKILEL